MPFRDQVAGFAGGTLGYIVGNTRGAITGYQLGRNFAKYSQRMPPIRHRTPRRRGRILNLQQSPYSMSSRMLITPRSGFSRYGYSSRRGSLALSRRSSLMSTSTVGRRSYASGSGSSSGYRGISSDAAAIRVKRKKGVTPKKKKRVKVSRKFKKKVEEALNNHLFGKYTKVRYARAAPPASNAQGVYDWGIFFRPIDFQDAADVLFNHNTPVEVPTSLDNDWSNPLTRRDRVIKSFVDIEMKNASQRTYTVKMFNCAPKSNPTDQAPNDGNADWISGLVLLNGNGANPQNNTNTTLYSDPRDSLLFNQFWKAEVTTVVLEPGESHTFMVEGPSQTYMDWTKMYAKNIAGIPSWMQAYAKWSRNVFFVYYDDLVESTLLTLGRYASGGTGPGGLIMEAKQVIEMEVPDTAGFVYPGTFPPGASQQLNNRVPARSIVVFGQAQSGAISDVLEENPVTMIDPTD